MHHQENFLEKKNKNYNSIIVLAKKEKFKNLLVYDAINKILNKNKILAPTLYRENYKKNYIEIQDFGNETIIKRIIKKNSNKLFYYKKVINLLIKIQSIKNKKIKNFRRKDYLIPEYHKKILINEANLFCDWYVDKKFSKIKKKNFSKEFEKTIKKLSSNIKSKNEVFVHRDFHVSNLMIINDKIGVIDSQDALIGNRAYDLASLIDDVRIKTSQSFKNKIFKFYLEKQKTISIKDFKNDFEILSVLRNLKIIGIFTRLAIRDGKKKYVKLIPYTWRLIAMRLNKNKIFLDLKILLMKNFKKELNEN